LNRVIAPFVTGVSKGDKSVLGRIPTTYLDTQQFNLPVYSVVASALGMYANYHRREKASLNSRRVRKVKIHHV
jgi:hypothetical protein